MCRSWQSLLVVLALSGCCQAHAVAAANDGHPDRATVRRDDTELTAALITGDEESARKLTDDIIAGKRSVVKAEVRDDRAVAPNVLLRTTYANRDYQLGVNTVSEYALCVLQIQNHTSSENILRIVAPALQQQCSEKKPCEVCNAQASPVNAEVKQYLIDYWVSKLK
jgi:hypothetical protein